MSMIIFLQIRERNGHKLCNYIDEQSTFIATYMSTEPRGFINLTNDFISLKFQQFLFTKYQLFNSTSGHN